MLASLNLREYFVDEITVKANEQFKGRKSGKKDESGTLKIQFDVNQSKSSKSKYMLPLTVELNTPEMKGNSYPYYVYVAIRGFFSFVEDTDEETMAKMIALNGLSILYGVARGIVSQITGNGPFGKTILPSVNFVEILKEKISAEQKQRDGEASTSIKKPSAKRRSQGIKGKNNHIQK
jgi:preprotein translocase subunit SecB